MARVTYREVEVKSALNAVKGMPFDWSLIIYGMHSRMHLLLFKGLQRALRERDVGDAFDKNSKSEELCRAAPEATSKATPGICCDRAATDRSNFEQPTREIPTNAALPRALVDYPMPTSIVTKGPLVVRDIDVRRSSTRRPISPCTSSFVRRRRESSQDRPGTGHPDSVCAPCACFARLARRGGAVHAVLPGISDSEESLDAPRVPRAKPRDASVTDRSRIDAEIPAVLRTPRGGVPRPVSRNAALYQGAHIQRGLRPRARRRGSAGAGPYEFREHLRGRHGSVSPKRLQLQLAI